MKMITHLILTITIFSITFCGMTLSSISSVFAQKQQEFMVVATPYTPKQNLDFFFLNSIHPLTYLEVAGETPVFVSIITPDQKKEYEKAGYKPQIIDEHAGDLYQYYTMSTHHNHHKTAPNIANQLQKPEYKQQGLEVAYQLTTYNTLLKVAKGTSFSQLAIPELQEFNARQIRWNLVPPTGRTSLEVQNMFPSGPTSQPNNMTPRKGIENPFPMFFAIAIPLFLIYLIYRPRRIKKQYS